MKTFPQIIVGTYEEFILGYNIELLEDDEMKFVASVAEHSHKASIRCVTSFGHLLSSSGADEYIHIYNMDVKKHAGVLSNNSSTVTCLEFTPDGTHLMSAAQDGTICIYSVDNWSLVKIWKEAHKGGNGVIALSIHPSSKLALTIGSDNVLRTWNLIKGRQAYATNMSKKCSVGQSLNLVKWSKAGDHYVLGIGCLLEVYSVATAGVVYSVSSDSKVCCVDFTLNGLLCVGNENGIVTLHSITHQKELQSQKCHEGRIKCLRMLQVDDNDKVLQFIVTCGSVGDIKVWRLKLKKSNNHELILKGEVKSDCRITCLTTIEIVNQVKSEESIQEIESENVPRKKKKKTKETDEVQQTGVNSFTNGAEDRIMEDMPRKKKKAINENKTINKQNNKQ